MGSEKSISIVITNWNGRDLLEKCVPSVVEAAKGLGGDCELIVIDDCSTDDSVEYIETNFPQVKIISPRYNLGFQEASNYGVAESKGEIVVLLNNDIMLRQDSLPPLLDHFRSDDVFSVSSKLLMWDEATFLSGKRRGAFENGYFKLIDVGDEEHKASPSLFTTGGAGAFHRHRFLELHGFDRLYHPLYWEDVDLCYRAWKRGWRSLYEPESVMYHKHQATITKQMKRLKISYITGRNSYLFLWRNITERSLFLKHLSILPISLFKDVVKLKMRFPICFAMALLRLSRIVYLRKREKKESRLTDQEVLKIIDGGSSL